MNLPLLPYGIQVLLQVAVQVSLWLVVGIFLVGLASRRSPRAGADAATGVLGGVLLLTVLALAPWPSWCPQPWFGDETVREQPGPPDTGASGPDRELSHLVNLSEIGSDDPGLKGTNASARSQVTSEGKANGLDTKLFRSIPAWVLVGVVIISILGCWGGLRFVAALWAVRECRRRSRPINDPQFQQLCDELRKTMGVRHPVALRLLAGLGSPGTIGWRQPVILLPEDWCRWDRTEQTSVLAHELAHIRRSDYAGWVLARLSAALHAYQPMLYWLIGRLRTNQELAADSLAARFAGGPACYTQALCRLALGRNDHRKPGLARAFLPAQISLTRRVQMLLSRNKTGDKAISNWWRVGLGVALLLGCLAMAGVRSPAVAESSPPEVAETVPPPAPVEALPEPPRPANDDKSQVEKELPCFPPLPVSPSKAGSSRKTAPCSPEDDRVLVELRVLKVSTALAARFQKEFRGNHKTTLDPNQAKQIPNLAFWNEKQTSRFLKAFQGDGQSEWVTRPRVMVCSGQWAKVEIGQQRHFVTGFQVIRSEKGNIVFVPKAELILIGTELSVQPVVSADRKYLRLNLKGRMRHPVSDQVPLIPIQVTAKPQNPEDRVSNTEPYTQYVQVPKFNHLDLDLAISLPEGSTAVLSGWEFKRVRNGKQAETERFTLMLTPHILGPDSAPDKNLSTNGAQTVSPPIAGK